MADSLRAVLLSYSTDEKTESERGEGVPETLN